MPVPVNLKLKDFFDEYNNIYSLRYFNYDYCYTLEKCTEGNSQRALKRKKPTEKF